MRLKYFLLSTLTPIQTFQMGIESHETVSPLREHLETVPASTFHYGEHPLNVCKRDFMMEQIAHAIDENGLRPSPAERKFQHVLLRREFEAVGVVQLTHRPEALRHALRVAVLAAQG